MPNADVESVENLENLFTAVCVAYLATHKRSHTYSHAHKHTHTHEACIAPRAAGRRHGRYKWAGQPVVPSGHEEETHGPAGALQVREGRERKKERTREKEGGGPLVGGGARGK